MTVFSPKDLEIIKNAVLGAIPGGKYTGDLIQNNNLNTDTAKNIPVAAGLDLFNAIKNIPHMVASTVATPGISLADAVGPKVRSDYQPINSIDLPVVGNQSSYQQQRQNLMQQGAGDVVTNALPAVQWLASVLGTKGLLNLYNKRGGSDLEGQSVHSLNGEDLKSADNALAGKDINSWLNGINAVEGNRLRLKLQDVGPYDYLIHQQDAPPPGPMPLNSPLPPPPMHSTPITGKFGFTVIPKDILESRTSLEVNH